MFPGKKSLSKIESLKKGHFVTYVTTVNHRKIQFSKVRRLRSLCVDIYKSINSINPSFTNVRVRVTNRAVQTQYRLNLDIS